MHKDALDENDVVAAKMADVRRAGGKVGAEEVDDLGQDEEYDNYTEDDYDVGLMVNAYGAPRGSSICEVRVRDSGRPTTFEIL